MGKFLTNDNIYLIFHKLAASHHFRFAIYFCTVPYHRLLQHRWPVSVRWFSFCFADERNENKRELRKPFATGPKERRQKKTWALPHLLQPVFCGVNFCSVLTFNQFTNERIFLSFPPNQAKSAQSLNFQCRIIAAASSSFLLWYFRVSLFF